MLKVKQTRKSINTDKKNVVNSVHAVFDQLQQTLEDRRQEVIEQVKFEFRNQLNEIDDIFRSMQAVSNRCKNIFPGRQPGPSMEYVKSMEKILDFQS